MEKLKDLLPKENINEAKITAKQLRSDLSDYINKNADKIAKEFIPKGTPYFIKKNYDGISFMVGGKARSTELGNIKSETQDYIKIDINLAQATGAVTSANYFDKAKMNEGSVSNYYSRSESPVRAAARKIDDFLKTLITDKRQLDKLTDLISDLVDEYADERVDNWEMDKLHEGKKVNGIDLDDYANDFQNYIAKKYRGKSISMWKLSVDGMSGSFYWYKPGSKIEVLATPFWDGEEKLPVDIQNTDSGDYISQKSYPLKFTGDMKKDEESYFKILRQVLSKVK